MKRQLLFFAKVSILVCSLCSPLIAFALTPFAIPNISYRQSLLSHIEYYEDKTNALGLSDIMHDPSIDFLSVTNGTIQKGYTDTTYWLRFQITNKNNTASENFLEFTYPRLSQIDLYSPDKNNRYHVLHSGNNIPYDDKPIQLSYHVFPLDVDKNKTATYYVKIKSSSTIYIPVYISNATGLAEHLTIVQALLGVFYGITIGSFFYNLFIYLTTRNQSYFYFLLLTIGFIGCGASFNGYSAMLFSKSDWWKSIDIYFFMVFSFYFGASMTQTHFLMGDEYRRTNIVINLYKVPCAIFIIILPLMKISQAAQISAILCNIGSLMMFITGISQLEARRREAAIYSLSWLVLLITLVISTFSAINILNYYECAIWMIQSGMCCTVLLLSVGFADKINALNAKLYQEVYEKNAAQQKLINLNSNLETTVKQRTNSLKNTNDELKLTLENLKQTQSELIHAEKMSALGGLVAGVAHEINTPIGITITAATLIEDQTTVVIDEYEKNTLKKGKLEEYLLSIQSGTNLILTNTQRAGKLITSFKQIAVDQVSEQNRLIHLKGYIQETLVTLSVESDLADIEIIVEGPVDLQTNCPVGSLSQIISQLISNSRLHGFEKGRKGYILLSVSLENEMIKLIYEDNGVGIDKDAIKKIFEPFFTTKRSDGYVGLGLHILQNLVTQKLGGNIIVESELDHFTRFIIRFPHQPGKG